MDAFHTSVSRAAGDSLDCQGENANFWNSVKVASASINISHTYGQSLCCPFHYPRTLAWRDVPGQWDKDKKLCPEIWCNLQEGAIAAIDLVIGILDEDHGCTRSALTLRLSDHMALTQTQDLAIEHVPRLLGLEDSHSCHGSNIKIFIYRLPQFAHMLKPLLRCAQKMPQCTASVHIHRWLESGSCLTEDPDSADLFFLPAYEACYNETACAAADDTERCWPNDFDPLSLPYFSRRGGQDHMFLFACNLLPFMDSIMIRARNSIMVTVESFQAANFAGPNMLAWLVHSKDVLIPGYISKWRLTAMLAFNRPMMQRNILAIFHGHT
ncbi:BRIX1, partial [Symbiodinium microadriaticum]